MSARKVESRWGLADSADSDDSSSSAFSLPVPLISVDDPMSWRRRIDGGAEKASWLSATSVLRDATSRTPRESLLEALSDAGTVMLPCAAITSDDCLAMVIAISTAVPPSDAALAAAAADVVERVVRGTALHLTPRSVDLLVGFLLKLIAAAVAPSGGSRTTAVLALRALGCVLFEHGERCAKWHESVHRALVPLLAPPRAGAAPPPQTEDTLSCVLVAVGNLVLRGGTKARERHAAFFYPVMRVLSAGAALPATTLTDVEYAARVLSSALRALYAMLVAGDSAVRA